MIMGAVTRSLSSGAQRLQRGGGPLHVGQRARGAPQPRAGAGGRDVALSALAAPAQLPGRGRHLLHPGHGGGGLGENTLTLTLALTLPLANSPAH